MYECMCEEKYQMWLSEQSSQRNINERATIYMFIMNNFEFYVKTRKALGKNCNKIYEDLKEIYSDDCPHKATI